MNQISFDRQLPVKTKFDLAGEFILYLPGAHQKKKKYDLI